MQDVGKSNHDFVGGCKCPRRHHFWDSRICFRKNTVGTCVLILEQFTLIFDRLFDCCQLVSEFREGCKSVECMVRTLWVTLKTHMLMDGFVKNRLKYNSTISVSFIYFLTMQAGSNVSAGIGSKLRALKEKLSKEIRKVVTLAWSIDVDKFIVNHIRVDY